MRRLVQGDKVRVSEDGETAREDQMRRLVQGDKVRVSEDG